MNQLAAALKRAGISMHVVPPIKLRRVRKLMAVCEGCAERKFCTVSAGAHVCDDCMGILKGGLCGETERTEKPDQPERVYANREGTVRRRRRAGIER